MNSSGCLTSSRVQFSMYTLPCTMSCPSMRKFRRVSEGAVSGTLIKTSAGLGFDAFVVMDAAVGQVVDSRVTTTCMWWLCPAAGSVVCADVACMYKVFGACGAQCWKLRVLVRANPALRFQRLVSKARDYLLRNATSNESCVRQ